MAVTFDLLKYVKFNINGEKQGHTCTCTCISLFWPKCKFEPIEKCKMEPFFCMLACFYIMVNIILCFFLILLLFPEQNFCKKALFLLIQKDEFTTSVSSLSK